MYHIRVQTVKKKKNLFKSIHEVKGLGEYLLLLHSIRYKRNCDPKKRLFLRFCFPPPLKLPVPLLIRSVDDSGIVVIDIRPFTVFLQALFWGPVGTYIYEVQLSKGLHRQHVRLC